MKRLLLLVLVMSPAWAAETIRHVEHGTNSVILNLPLYDKTDPSACPSTDLTDETVGLKITLYDDVTNGELDQFECTGAAGCGTTDTIEPITTLGTYAAPSANNARFEVLEAGSCWYQLMLADAIFDTASINVINIEITDGQSGIIDANYIVDLTPVSQTTLIASLLGTDCSSYGTVDDVGYQICTVNNAILTDTGTTLNTTVNSIQTAVTRLVVLASTADSGNTTTIVDADSLTQSNDYWNDEYRVIVEFSEGTESRCVTDFDAASDTLTVAPAFDNSVGTEEFALIPDAGCNLTAQKTAASYLAEINAEVDTALTDIGLDHIVSIQGTADSGTATTLVDAALTQADFYWNNTHILVVQFATGPEARCVRGFTASSDTLSVTPAFSQAVATEDYTLVPSLTCRNFP